MYKAKLFENTEADGVNGILKNASISVPLKYLRNFWRSLEMSSINSKVELKPKWANYCVLSAAGADIDNNGNNIIFTIKDTKLHVPVVTLSARYNQKLSTLLSEGFERLVYWNEYKTRSETKTTTNDFIYFLESNLVGVNRLFVYVYPNRDAESRKSSKKLKKI